jgi:hypothetical protein
MFAYSIFQQRLGICCLPVRGHDHLGRAPLVLPLLHHDARARNGHRDDMHRNHDHNHHGRLSSGQKCQLPQVLSDRYDETVGLTELFFE